MLLKDFIYNYVKGSERPLSHHQIAKALCIEEFVIFIVLNALVSERKLRTSICPLNEYITCSIYYR